VASSRSCCGRSCPYLQTFVRGLGRDPCPLPTRIVIGASNFVGSYFGLAFLVAFAAIIFGLKVWYGTAQGRFYFRFDTFEATGTRHLDAKKIAVARLLPAHLVPLISSGVPILEGTGHYRQNRGKMRVVERSTIEGAQSP